MKKSFLVFAVLVTVLASAALASADTIFTFTTSGSSGAYSVNGTAKFDFTGTQLKLTLNNTTSNVTDIPQELDALAWSGFTLSGTPTVTAADVVNCNGFSGSSCPDYTSGASPYGWALATSQKLGAGGSAYHPDAIVDTYTAPGGNGQISNPEHNPLLIGPVTFTWAYTGAPTAVSNVTFYWGTVPGTTQGQACTPGAAGCDPTTVPEPATMAMLGSGLLAAGLFARKKKKK